MNWEIKAGYLGWVGHGNLGDEAMYEAFRKRLFFGLEIIPISHTNIPGDLDVAFLGGGTLINRDPLYLSTFQKVAASCPTYVFGTGVCSAEFWRTRPGWIDLMGDWVDCLRSARFIGVRGPHSKQRLVERGLENIQVVGDLALSLGLHNVKGKKHKKQIGINIGTSDGNLWGTEGDVLTFIIKAGRELIRRGWQITFVPVYAPDLPYIEAAAKQISSPKVKIFREFDSISATMNMLEKLDVFIGEKLHSVVLALSAYTPSIMLAYRPKCLDFMASLGLQVFSMRTDQLSVKQLLYMIDGIYEQIVPTIFQSDIWRRVRHYQIIQHGAAHFTICQKLYKEFYT